jgi:hypothetical protein
MARFVVSNDVDYTVALGSSDALLVTPGANIIPTGSSSTDYGVDISGSYVDVVILGTILSSSSAIYSFHATNPV